MRILFSLLFIICFDSSLAQRVFYTSQELSRTDTIQSINIIRPHWLGGKNNIIVIYKNGARQKIRRDSIWGFEDRNHSVYRSYQGDIYRMEQEDDLLLYTCGTCRYSYVRYSKTPDSPLYVTKRRARKENAIN